MVVRSIRPFSAPRVWFWAVCLIILSPISSESFDDRDTHRRMTRVGVLASNLDSFVKTDLGIGQGVDTQLRGGLGQGQTILRWLQDGSELEDDPACRASNHFHNPLLPFSGSGVTDQPIPIQAFCSLTGFPQALSNVTWGTGFTSPTVKGPASDNPFDWDAARAAYLKALTLPAPTDREAALAQTFRILGHVLHLVQDLAVPAHVRNDFRSHLEYCSLQLDFTRWCENSFERFVRLRGELVDNAQPLPIEFNGNRLTRFWDLDRYTGTNPSTDTIQGLAEYTNANFASQHTIFTEAAPPADPHGFPFPRETSTDLPELIAQRKVVRQVTAEDGVLDTGLYVKKIADGEVIDHFLKAGYLTDFAISNLFLRPSLRLTFQMDDVVLGDYAAKLLPRALGYSTGLLDYFFRGKLDADVIEADSSDPSRLQLVGTNGSPEVLKDGSLTVYADDPNGVRSLVTSVPLMQVEPNATIPAIPFQAPQNTERFVAVYQGTLGQEVKNAVQTNPGAVIGKVLGGVRVEEVFSDGIRWRLRTPQGVFPLPIPPSAVANLRWGAKDNMLVGHSYFFPGMTEASFYVYEINRPVGSSDVPIVDIDGRPHVDARLVKQVPFPFGGAVGSVNFEETQNYRQYTLSFTRNAVYDWTCEPAPGCFYKLSLTLTDLTATLMNSEEVSFEQSVPLRLDADSLMPRLCCPSGYLWEFRDIGLSASGQILALVAFRVFGVQQTKNVPVSTLELRGGAPQRVEIAQPETLYRTHPPRPIDVWALVDVALGTVVASTAPPVTRVSYKTDLVLIGTSRFDNTALMFQKQQLIGGPTPRGPEYTGMNTLPRKGCGSASMPVIGEVEWPSGYRDVTISQYRPEIQTVQFPLQTSESDPVTGEWIYLCPDTDQLGAKAVITFQDNNFSQGRIDDMRLTADVGQQSLVMLMAQNPVQGNFGETFQSRGRVGVWKFATGGAELRQEFASLADRRELLSQTSRLGLVSSFVFDPATFQFLSATTLLSLSGPFSSTLFPDEDMTQFVLLEPDLLYNTADLKFYRKQAPLQRTALPATLARFSIEEDSPRAYHVLRLR